jgi:hypothetical protein
MRSALFAALFIVAGCGAAAEPHPFPTRAQAQFHASCPADNPVCVCTWDNITRTLTHEEYEAAMERFRAEGRMDPRLTRVNTRCRERHAGS